MPQLGTASHFHPRQYSLVDLVALVPVRLDLQLSGWLEAEAVVRRLTPSALLRELVKVGPTDAEWDAAVTIRLSNLRRAIGSVAQRTWSMISHMPDPCPSQRSTQVNASVRNRAVVDGA
jgi:hypothetical protein